MDSASTDAQMDSFLDILRNEKGFFSGCYVCAVLSKTQWMFAVFFIIVISFVKDLMLQKTLYLKGKEVEIVAYSAISN